MSPRKIIALFAIFLIASCAKKPAVATTPTVIPTPFYSRPDEVTYAKLVQFDPAAALADTFDYFGVTQNYTGIPTTQAKTRLAMQNAGGIMFWALDHDAQGEYSLVEAIHQEVNRGP